MTIENQQDYISYRLQKADESFADAELLAENGRWNSVVNRLYYASFYSVISLLLSRGMVSTSPSYLTCARKGTTVIFSTMIK